ncbi:MAG: hypothetical protein EU532_12620, partial [Promethearchaeota archaeon]
DSGEERLIVNVLFKHIEGNIDIVVFRTTPTPFVIENNSITDNEYINCIVSPGIYYLGIKGDNNATIYNLWWNDEDPNGPTPVLEYSSHILDDDSTGLSFGDGDNTVEAGEIIELSIILENTGTGPTTGVNAVLSTSDPLITILDNSANYPDIDEHLTGQSVDNYSLFIDSSHSSGNVFFTLEINSNEGSWVDDVNININARPDLIDRGTVYSEFNPTVVMPGKTTFNVSCEISNLGGIASGSFNISYYVSLDYLITKDDHFLGNKTISSVDAHAFVEASWSGIFPDLIEGIYNIGWIIDSGDEIEEANESNNIGVKIDSQLNVVKKPELLDGGDNYSDFNNTAIIPEFEYLKIWCFINNTGILSSGPFNISFYLSIDTTFSISDYFLGKITILNIDVKDYINCTWIGNISSEIPKGYYYIIWIIDCDGDVDEHLENNNFGIKISKQLFVLNSVIPPAEEDDDSDDNKDNEKSTITGYDFYFFSLAIFGTIFINVMLFIKKRRRTRTILRI